MKTNNHKKLITIFTIFFFSLIFAAQSYAANLLTDAWKRVELKRSTLENVDDGAGRFQFEGGAVYSNRVHIADYAATRRVTYGGTDGQNTAMLTMTIFILGSKPPQNITLQGSHDFSSGKYIGSVSAASSAYSRLIGAQFVGYTAKGVLYFRK